MSDGKLNFVIHGLELTEKQEKKMHQKVEKLLKFDASVSSVDVNIRKREEAGAAISVEIRLNAKGEFFASKEGGNVRKIRAKISKLSKIGRLYPVPPTHPL